MRVSSESRQRYALWCRPLIMRPSAKDCHPGEGRDPRCDIVVGSVLVEAWIPAFAGMTGWFGGILKEDADVFRQQHVLVEDQLAVRDLPFSVDASQDIPPGADVEILLGLGAAAVDDEVGIDPELRVHIARFDLDIADHVAGSRWWVLCPGHAGIEARDPAAQRLLGFVEDGQLVLSADIVLDVA